ncbi:hypothetical protein EVAR_99520_1 [Eumeta japonica]|uniref:Uncharacterized protein n=1 Tax=Eumeta variegata TaxID=151549 RepID=A0A4C1SDN4_EUMVA|nr:hypothetical protein EVAR_99520_1 [Eumeta japonica]
MDSCLVSISVTDQLRGPAPQHQLNGRRGPSAASFRTCTITGAPHTEVEDDHCVKDSEILADSGFVLHSTRGKLVITVY